MSTAGSRSAASLDCHIRLHLSTRRGATVAPLRLRCLRHVRNDTRSSGCASASSMPRGRPPKHTHTPHALPCMRRRPVGMHAGRRHMPHTQWTPRISKSSRNKPRHHDVLPMSFPAPSLTCPSSTGATVRTLRWMIDRSVIDGSRARRTLLASTVRCKRLHPACSPSCRQQQTQRPATCTPSASAPSGLPTSCGCPTQRTTLCS